jgi:hypothetical protein
VDFLGGVTVKTNKRGHAGFTWTSPGQAMAVGDYVTATATDRATGDTSEFALSRIVTTG